MKKAVRGAAPDAAALEERDRDLLQLLQSLLGEEIRSHRHGSDMLEVVIRPDSASMVARLLRDSEGLEFDYLMDQTAVDWLGRREVRFELVYHFYSTKHNRYLRCLAPVPESRCEAASLYELYKAADWYEREIHEMYGIRFAGHHDMRKLLMYDGFKGYPLRKDYSMKGRQPLIGPGSRQES